jgi:hypothetical protein
MKVKGLDVNLGTNFGHRIGSRVSPEGRRGLPVASFRPGAGGRREFDRFLGRRGDRGRRVVEEPSGR